MGRSVRATSKSLGGGASSVVLSTYEALGSMPGTERNRRTVSVYGTFTDGNQWA